MKIGLEGHPKIKQQQAIKELIEALSEPMRNALDYGEVQHKTLILHFKHPAMVQEFGMQREAILQKMREIYRNNSLREKIVFERVEAKAKFTVPQKQPIDKNLPFDEQAKGEFENNIADPRMHAMFEKIRSKIKERRNDTKAESGV